MSASIQTSPNATPRVSRIRSALFAAVGIFLILLVSDVMSATSPNAFITLSDVELRPEQTAQIRSILSGNQIKYRHNDNMTEILVRRRDKPYVLLRLAQERVTLDARSGWGKLISDETDPDHSSDAFVQSEAEQALRRLDAVDDAKVSINRYRKNPKNFSLSIVLRILPETDVTDDQVKAIREWICREFDDLPPEKVVITDTRARNLGA